MSKRKVPQTSKYAYASLDPSKLNETYRKILQALVALNEATSQEIAAWLKINHDVIWKRMVDVERMGLIYKPGTKKMLKSGRMGFCYRLTSKSMPKTEADIKSLKNTPTVADHSRNIKAITESAKQLNLL
jgi:predicted transcriptional regulator